MRTYATLFVVDLGPYEIVGVVHSTSASDPLGAVLRRAAWVPIADASITYRRGPATVTEDVDVLLVNRNLTSLFRATEGRFPVAHATEDTAWRCTGAAGGNQQREGEGGGASSPVPATTAGSRASAATPGRSPQVP